MFEKQVGRLGCGLEQAPLSYQLLYHNNCLIYCLLLAKMNYSYKNMATFIKHGCAYQYLTITSVCYHVPKLILKSLILTTAVSKFCLSMAITCRDM